MKIVDLDVADATCSESIRKISYPQKYLLLELGNEVYSLEVSDVSRSAIYLKIADDDVKQAELRSIKQ